MSKIINTCGKKACCPQILEEAGQYKIFDEEKDWATEFMSKKELKNIGKAINKIA